MQTEAIDWFSVDEELPDDDAEVLFITHDGDVYMGCRCDGGWWNGFERRVFGVEHWAPAPAGPSGDRQSQALAVSVAEIAERCARLVESVASCPVGKPGKKIAASIRQEFGLSEFEGEETP